jgi:GTPase SAR1 family protein
LLLRQFCAGALMADDDPPPTIGVDFQTCRVMLTHPATGLPIQAKLNIWDASGQPRYASVAHKFLSNVHGALCVYDVTNPASLRGAVAWYRSVHQASPRAACMLVGTKRDQRLVALSSVSRAEGEAAAQRLQAEFFEVSAKTGGDQVTQLFIRAAQASLLRSSSPPASPTRPPPPPPATTQASEAASTALLAHADADAVAAADKKRCWCVIC